LSVFGSMLKKVRKTVATHRLLRRGEHVLAAVSGGPDSVALLHVLKMLQNEYNLHIDAAHLNHGLRGSDADNEEGFVRALCDEMRVRLFVKKVDIGILQKKSGKSLEEAAREERYRFLYQEAQEHGDVKIATGHHRDDQAETFLINLLRGSGPEGLKGITPIRDGCLIRPLLYVRRDEILEFLTKEGLSYMTDGSNSDVSFLRNRIRKELIPELEKRYNPNLTEGLARTAEIIRVENDYLRDVVQSLIFSLKIDINDKKILLPLRHFSEQHEAVQARMIKFLLEEISPSKQGVGYRHVRSVMELCEKDDARMRRLHLPFGIVVEKQPALLMIKKEREADKRKTNKNSEKERFEIKVKVPDLIHLEERSILFELIDKPLISEMKNHYKTAFMDYGTIEGPLLLRNIRPGDRMDFLGLGGTKKLKDYFIDKKIPRGLRADIPLLVDSRSVIWIAGERISQRVCVTENTKKVLKVELF
jgi:tRNA(Ile)-lysidine synthase